MTIRIFGAGMAGLLTASMLRRHRPIVHDLAPTLPDNHGALLRFRTDAVARETGIPFRKVYVHKAVCVGGIVRADATLRDANMYSLKVTGEVAPRSILDLAPCTRYIAPPDFLTALARDAILKFNRPLTLEDIAETGDSDDDVIISTIPMPALMKLVEWPDPPRFRSRPVWSVTATFADPICDLHQTIYYPDPALPFYRASFTGNRLTVEFFEDPTPSEAWRTALERVTQDFGLPSGWRSVVAPPKRQEFGKLVPLDDRTRREFILAMTDTYNVYSVGRFSTWRQILLDDVVQDVRAVEAMVTQRSTYVRRLKSALPSPSPSSPSLPRT